MTSPASDKVASPWWVARDVGLRSAEPVPFPLALARPPARAGRPTAGPLRFERAARRRSEGRVAVALAVLWVVLWTVFTLGVLVPAATVHERGPAEAPGAQGSRSSYTFQSPLIRTVLTPGSNTIRSKNGLNRSSKRHAT
jgi:hypothetical protein